MKETTLKKKKEEQDVIMYWRFCRYYVLTIL